MVMSRDRIRRIIREEYLELYEPETVPRFSPDTKIYADLHIHEHCLGKAAALEWRANVAKRLCIKEDDLIKPDQTRDYTISELVTAVQSALSA